MFGFSQAVNFARAREAKILAALANTDVLTLQQQIDSLQSQITALNNTITTLQGQYTLHTHPYTDIDNTGAVQNKTTSAPN